MFTEQLKIRSNPNKLTQRPNIRTWKYYGKNALFSSGFLEEKDRRGRMGSDGGERRVMAWSEERKKLPNNILGSNFCLK